MENLFTKKNIGLSLIGLASLLYIHLVIGPAIAAGLLILWYIVLGLVLGAVMTSAALGIRRVVASWQISTAEVEAARAEAKIKARHIVSFGRDQQVFEIGGKNETVRAFHLTPYSRFSGPTIVSPTPQELVAFQLFHRPTGVSKTPQAMLPAPVTEPIPNLVKIEDLVQPKNISLNRLVLGVGPGNEIIRGSLKELSHIGVGGTSQWGKSIFLQSLLYQVLLAKENTEVFLSDIGGTSFVDFNLPYADDIASTEKMASHLWTKVLERKKLYQSTEQGVRSLEMYNRITDMALPYLVFICDETTVLMGQSRPLTQHLLNLVAYAGKYGLELVLAGQNWKSSKIDTAIRDQFSSRFQFRAMDRYQANILISDSQADGITVKGRACAYLPEYGKLNLQVPHIEVETIQALSTLIPALKPQAPQSQSQPQPQPTPTESERAILNAWDQHHAFPEMHRELTGASKPGGTDYTRYQQVLDRFGRKWTP